ncbi:MAG: glycoside hydrolase [Spirochaetes bacterium RBG_16_67_19]|nr:MAG: glycoside hydrolase [Spirochaetes bacterium RBG_16_67_19]
MRGYLALVLHSHLPFVRHPEAERFLEENWLYEAITETYLPLLAVFERLERDGVPFRLTLSVSPSLAEMLGDPLLQSRYLSHLERLQELAEREVNRTWGDARLSGLARMYLERFRACREAYEGKYQRNLLAALAGLEQRGHLELITSCASHSFLPTLSLVPHAVRSQVAVAVRSHIRHFGGYPRGFWLPECGYYPGVEEFLREQDLHYTFLETHGLLYADRRPRYGVYAPVACPNKVAVFGRDPDSARAVWSSEEGYPGDPVYREFYRDIGFELPLEDLGPFLYDGGLRAHTGIKYWAITAAEGDKAPYQREAALKKCEEHAEQFVRDRLHQAERLRPHMDRPPLIVCPYDAELFGHWWFEGPEWIEALLRRLARSAEKLRMVTASDYLEAHSELQVLQPCFSSWGNKGYAEVWLESSNDWIYRHLHKQAERMQDLARRFPNEKGLRRRALNQAFRELLLAQASDWAFIMKTGTTVPYAVKRTREHIHNFTRIFETVMENEIEQEWLLGLEARNNIFPEIDYRLFGKAST